MNKHKLPNIQPLSNAVTALAKKNWIPDCHRDAQYHSRAKKWKNFPEWQTLYHRFFYCILVLNEKSSDNIGIVIPKRQLEWGLLVLLLWTVRLQPDWTVLGYLIHARQSEHIPTIDLKNRRVNGRLLSCGPVEWMVRSWLALTHDGQNRHTQTDGKQMDAFLVTCQQL